MEKVNLFTVRRTEAIPETTIDWERDFPQVLNRSCGNIELVRDRRRRLTIAERKERKEQKAAKAAEDFDNFLFGALTGLSAAGFLAAFVIGMCGGL